ncbi:glycosyltransferase family 39 protein [Candidatus Saccharibacteria bacterium]|nr:glycosyltransferase family 39 protein [Candidatus Saccharibacteria bacterium]
MKKIIISRLFLYKHRFGIVYTLLALAFIGLLFLMPLIAPAGLSQAEMESVVTSNNTNLTTIMHGDIVDLPYHILQKYSVKFLGLHPYAIKLPSIIIGLILGLLLIALLNRWFKNNVAIIASILTVLSSSFLYVANSGTPLIMLVFWPTLLLWLGSKIQGKHAPRPIWCFIFAFFLLLSILTPYLIYLAMLIVFFVLISPHLRFTIKSLPKIPLILTGLVILAGTGLIGYISLRHPTALATLTFIPDFSWGQYLKNLTSAFLPFFSWHGNVESTFLSPLVGLASLALALAGLFSTAKGFFASRNSIASFLIVYTVIISGLFPDAAILLILPLAILIAHGIRYILTKWYDLFPENPYARVFAIIPISIFLGVIIISDVAHFMFGYRYNPPVAREFNNDLQLIEQNISDDTILLIPGGTLEYDFYKILEQHTNITVTSNLPEASTASHIASLGKWPTDLELSLVEIITSSKSENSDRIYIYTAN